MRERKVFAAGPQQTSQAGSGSGSVTGSGSSSGSVKRKEGGTRRIVSKREASQAKAVELVNEWRRLARRLASSLAKDGRGQWMKTVNGEV